MAVLPLDANRVAFLAKNDVSLSPIEPLGARVRGVDLRSSKKPPPAVVAALQKEMAQRGFLVFEGQGELTAAQQIRASELWGGKEMHSTHGVHPQAPHRHVFRLSNDPKVGILGVGPQWHNDGSFEIGVFSHVGYHIVRVPEKGGGTVFAHQGAAFDALPPEKKDRWQKLVSVNATSGVLHPLVHSHPISGRKSVYLHLGMTGAVLESLQEEQAQGRGKDEETSREREDKERGGRHKKKKQDEEGAGGQAAPVDLKQDFRLLEAKEMSELFKDYHELLNQGLVSALLALTPCSSAGRRHARTMLAQTRTLLMSLARPETLGEVLGQEHGYATCYEYAAGDCVFIDNLTVAHRAAPEAHLPAAEHGLRILHRTTVRAMRPLLPPFGLPPALDITARSPFKRGVWLAGGIGFRWDPAVRLQN